MSFQAAARWSLLPGLIPTSPTSSSRLLVQQTFKADCCCYCFLRHKNVLFIFFHLVLVLPELVWLSPLSPLSLSLPPCEGSRIDLFKGGKKEDILWKLTRLFTLDLSTGTSIRNTVCLYICLSLCSIKVDWEGKDYEMKLVSTASRSSKT